MELIIIDDGSSDASNHYENIINQYFSTLAEGNITKIEILTKDQNMGIVDSCLLGIELATGEYINFKSVDDLYCNNLQLILEEMKQSDMEIVQFPYLFYNQLKHYLQYIKPTDSFFEKDSGSQYQCLLKKHNIVVGACIFKSNVLKEDLRKKRIQQFKYSFERPLILELAKEKHRINVSKTRLPLYCYIRNKDSVSNWLFKSDLFFREQQLLKELYGIYDSNHKSDILSRVINKIHLRLLKSNTKLRLSLVNEQKLLNSDLDWNSLN